MTYTVTWAKQAQEELAETWLRATDRSAVTRGANVMDRLLRVDPWSYREVWSEQDRILVVQPLGILFNVSEADRLVDVFLIWRIESS